MQRLLGFISLTISVMTYSVWLQVFDYGSSNSLWIKQCSAITLVVITFFTLFTLMKSIYETARSNYEIDCTKRKNTLYFALLVSFVSSTFWVLTFYPAAMSNDATSMWVQHGSGFQIPGMGRYDDWFPPLNAMLMDLFKRWTTNPSLFALCQGFLLWFSIIFSLREVLKNERFYIAASLFVLSFPPLWSLSVRILHDVWCASFALLAAAFLIKYVKRRLNIDFIVSLIFLSVSICFRHNAFFLIICPIFVCLFFNIWNCSNSRKFLLSVMVIIVSVLPSKTIEYLPEVQKMNTSGIVFVNQYVGVIKNSDSLSPDTIDSEKKSIDEHFGNGTFDKLMTSYTCTFSDYVWVVSPPIINQSKLRESSSFIISKTIHIALKYPLAYVKHRLCNISSLLQIPLISTPYYYEMLYPNLVQPQISQFPHVKSLAVGISKLIIGHFDLLYRTWVFLLLNSIILVFFLKERNPEKSIVAIFGIVYFLSYVIPDAAPDWRYLILSYICSIISIIGYVEYRFVRWSNLR